MPRQRMWCSAGIIRRCYRSSREIESLLRADITKHRRLPPVALDRLENSDIERFFQRAAVWQRKGIFLRLECRIDQLDRGRELRVDDPGEQWLVVDEGVERG